MVGSLKNREKGFLRESSDSSRQHKGGIGWCERGSGFAKGGPSMGEGEGWFAILFEDRLPSSEDCLRRSVEGGKKSSRRGGGE